jgi:thiol-disulfide isomerase/thioredoxin
MKIFLAFAFLFVSFFAVSAQTEQAPIQEKEIKYKDWTYKTVADGKEMNLRQMTAGKKLTLVVYFAPWCPNWKHEAPFAQKLYDKYKANGLEVIGVGEYDTVEAMKTNLAFYKITFPVVYESESKDAKQKTKHYDYRKEVGDARNWGSPWNIFLVPAMLEAKGDTLTKKTFVASGELIEPEAEKFIREKLGLPAEETKAELAKDKTIEACPAEKNTLSLKKP